MYSDLLVKITVVSAGQIFMLLYKLVEGWLSVNPIMFSK